jgi:protein-S-isoprenylcysteine O-methyltransferase Ste14
MSNDYRKTLQRVRVTCGYIFAVVFLVFCRPSGTTLLVGVPIAVIGLLIRAWACGHLRKEKDLDTSGPYAFTRNPLYLGSFLIAIGFGVAAGVWWLAVIAIIFFLSIYLPVINVETSELESVIGEPYVVYSRNVPRFFPRLTPWKKSDKSFDFQLYWKNGEYNAALGVLAAALFLIARAYFLNSL